MNEWNIQSRAHACQACGRGFVDKEKYHTLLLSERSDLVRQDVCEACWTAQYSEGARERKGFISYWQAVYEAPVPKVEAIQKENAESLLRKLMELKDPKYIPAAYILAVMLERKRILKVKEQITREGQRFFVYEQPRTGDVFTILDPELHLDQLMEVQKAVSDLMEHGLPVEGAVAASPAETAEPAGEQSAGEAAESQGEDAPSTAAPEPERGT